MQYRVDVAAILQAAPKARHGFDARILQQRIEQRVELEAVAAAIADDDLLEQVGDAELDGTVEIAHVKVLEGDAALVREDDAVQVVFGKRRLGAGQAQLIPVPVRVRKLLVQFLVHGVTPHVSAAGPLAPAAAIPIA